MIFPDSLGTDSYGLAFVCFIVSIERLSMSWHVLYCPFPVLTRFLGLLYVQSRCTPTKSMLMLLLGESDRGPRYVTRPPGFHGAESLHGARSKI